MQNGSSQIKTGFAAPTQLKLRKALPERLRSLGLDEAWLQHQIADDTSLLGLGELEVIKKEKIQPAGGRIDFVLGDPEGETRYEVEVMLGSVDESHIIRTIEYWDIERQRYPMFEHQAVIVAEVITARFFNVIRLLNRAVPMIAIQLSAFRFADEVVPIFTRVLDIHEFSAEPEEVDTEQVDLAYWQKKTKPESLAFVNAIKELTPTEKGAARITYNKHHIALGTSGYNFCWFYPRKTIAHSHMNLKVGAENRPELVKKLEDVGIEAEEHKSDSVRLHLTTKDIQDHQAVISDALRVAEELSHK
jgi:hypothetical protein